MLLGKAESVESPYYIAAAQLNSYISTLVSADPTRLDFGHVLTYSPRDEYYLCITATCDCARPSDKLPNAQTPYEVNEACHYYSFVRGKRIQPGKLKDVFIELTKEASSYSFIQDSDSSVAIVKWDKTLVGMPASPNYSTGPDSSGRKLLVLMSTEPIELSFAQQMRAQFAQQIANRVAANLARVGVNWAQI